MSLSNLLFICIAIFLIYDQECTQYGVTQAWFILLLYLLRKRTVFLCLATFVIKINEFGLNMVYFLDYLIQ